MSDADNILLVMDSDKKIHTLHSFKVAEGTLLSPNTKLMCLLGAGLNTTAFLFNKQSFLNLCNLVTPMIDTHSKNAPTKIKSMQSTPKPKTEH
jgi:hypothetical protein